MDSFAENQMGRDEPPVTPEPSRRALRTSKDRASKEHYGVGAEMVVAGADQELLAVDVDAGAPSASKPLPSMQEEDDPEDPVDVPCMSMQESALIASRWERKKSSFMPVGDPYAEADNSSPLVMQLARQYCTCANAWSSLGRLLKRSFPVIEWAPKVNSSSLKMDVIAGLTVAVMLIPQSMSYANIAGLQYKYGLYTSVLPIITYGLMGTSRQLGVGPVAMVSLLVEVGLAGALTEEQCPAYFAQRNSSLSSEEWELQADLCPEEYAALAFLTSFLVGVFQIGAGFLNLGFLVSFLAHPVVSGFTSGAAIIIGLSQVGGFLGFKLAKSQFVHETIEIVITRLNEAKWQTVVLGLTWWFLLWYARRLSQKQKKRFGWLRPTAPLIVCVLGIFVGANVEIFNGCGFDRCGNGTKSEALIVGTIPSGVSSMGSIDKLDFTQISVVVGTAVSCSVIGYMESIAISKSLAAKHKYNVDPGQELIAIGVANVLGSMTSAYPVTGSFSRSAVNNQVGAQTQLAGLITGVMMLFTLLVLTPLFYFLPKFALSAIVISSVTNLIDYNECIHLWKVKKQDCLLWVIAFLGTLFMGVQNGLVGAIAVSLILVIAESVRPQMSVLWRLPGTPIYRNIKQESAGHFVPGVIVVRIGASMYFANVAFIRDYISKMVAEFSEAAEMTQLGTDGSAGSPRTAAHLRKESTFVTRHVRKAPDSPPNGSPNDISSTVTSSPVSANGTPADVDRGQWVAAEPIKYIVIEMTPVTSVDSTALHMLEDMHRDLKERGIRLCLSTVGNRVEETFKRAGLIDKMGAQWLHPSVHSAVQHCIRHRMTVADPAATSQAADAI